MHTKDPGEIRDSILIGKQYFFLNTLLFFLGVLFYVQLLQKSFRAYANKWVFPHV